MPTMDLDASVRAVCGRDPRFRPEAYHFLLEALDFTLTRRAREAGLPPAAPGMESLGVSTTGHGTADPASSPAPSRTPSHVPPSNVPASNVVGRDLLEGFRDLALDRFGALAHEVLRVWGITRTDDVGAVVFNMVEAGLLQKTATDSPADYHAVFDFEASLERAFADRLRSGDVRLDGRTADGRTPAAAPATEKPAGPA